MVKIVFGMNATYSFPDVSDIDAWSDDRDVYSMNDVVSLEEAEYPLTQSGDKWKIRDEFIDSDLGEIEE